MLIVPNGDPTGGLLDRASAIRDGLVLCCPIDDLQSPFTEWISGIDPAWFGAHSFSRGTGFGGLDSTNAGNPNSYANITKTPPDLTDDISIAIWVKSTESDEVHVFGLGGSTPPGWTDGASLSAYTASTGRMTSLWGSVAGGDYSLNQGAASIDFSDGNWHLMSIRADRGNKTINCRPDNATWDTTNSLTASDALNTPIGLNLFQYFPTIAASAGTELMQLMVWNRKLTDAEFDYVYRSGAGEFL